MPLDTLKKLEESVTALADVPGEKKAQLLTLLAELRREAVEQDGRMPETSDELRSTVREFEVTHPELVALTNRVCMMLANIGI